MRTANGEGCRDRRSKTYRVWKQLFGKCYNPNNKNFTSFGAVGITVCDRWRDYKVFIADVGHLPSAMFQFRLFENSTEFAPGKAGWVFASAGKSPNRRVITIDGKTDILANWLVYYNVKRQTFWDRLSRGMSEIEALTKNFHVGGGYFEF